MTSKGSSKCRSANVVYEASCIECLDLAERGKIPDEEVGIYIGETSRTLTERASEHVDVAKDVDGENFITKHWAKKHQNRDSQPRMRFKVIR